MPFEINYPNLQDTVGQNNKTISAELFLVHVHRLFVFSEFIKNKNINAGQVKHLYVDSLSHQWNFSQK